MKKSILLVRSNLRRAKGQTAAIVVLILLAALMLNLWLMLSMDYKRNFDRCHDTLNAEHVTLALDGDGEEVREFLMRTLEADARTAEISLDDSMHMVGLFEYNDGEINSEFVILEKQAALSRTVGRVEIVEEGGLASGIYMPVLYRSDKIAVGKTIRISIGSSEMTYTVCGFFNSVMAGSNNCGMCELLLTEDKYAELEEAGCAPKSTLCSVRLKDKADGEDYETMLKNAAASRYPAARAVSNSYAFVARSRYISQMICSGIVSAMAFIVLLIALVVIASNIVNYIQENMRNLGALKATGYTGRQLIRSLLVQFLGLSLAAAAGGVGISYLLFPAVNEMMIAQTGIPYRVRFLPLPFLITLLILGGTIALVVWLSSHRIQRVEPVVALRQGVRTHNFKRNRIPLEKTGAPLTLALALKTTFSGIKQNLIVCITMLVLSLVAVFSGLMARNVISDMTPFLRLIVGETADSCINVNVEIEDEFLRQMRADGRVEKIYLYNSAEVRHVGGIALMATMTEDFSEVNNQSVVFKGRFPKFDNEIAIAAKYAEERDLKIGNEITVTAGGNEAQYIISGFTQVSNNLGK
ncbi:MAG: ABC transporter permease, partial [Lachnospiraceae bacterium]|nr:ABC transporter permease [Lachnospiraceae bacterium]